MISFDSRRLRIDALWLGNCGETRAGVASGAAALIRTAEFGVRAAALAERGITAGLALRLLHCSSSSTRAARWMRSRRSDSSWQEKGEVCVCVCVCVCVHTEAEGGVHHITVELPAVGMVAWERTDSDLHCPDNTRIIQKYNSLLHTCCDSCSICKRACRKSDTTSSSLGAP